MATNQLASVVVAFAVSAILSFLLARSRWSFWPRDTPNERSLHTVPTPRTGGIAILLGLAASLLVASPRMDAPSCWIAALTLFLAIVSFADDRFGLPAGVRFAAHALAASCVVWGAGLSVSHLWIPFAGDVPLGGLGPPLSALGLVWMANLYNFMDGMDGLAGAMTAIGGGTLGVALLGGGDPAAASGAFALAASAAGFLLQNAPPARIFMGDVGAVPIGFLAGALTLHGSSSGAVDPGVTALAFAPFVVDATVTLLRRVARRERVWEAHRSHYYQRLVLTGLTHGHALLLECVLMLVAAAAALIWSTGSAAARLAALAAVLAAAAAVHVLTRLRERRGSPSRA